MKCNRQNLTDSSKRPRDDKNGQQPQPQHTIRVSLQTNQIDTHEVQYDNIMKWNKSNSKSRNRSSQRDSTIGSSSSRGSSTNQLEAPIVVDGGGSNVAAGVGRERFQTKLLMQENESLKDQLADLRADRDLLSNVLQETRQHMSTMKDTLQGRIDELTKEVDYYRRKETARDLKEENASKNTDNEGLQNFQKEIKNTLTSHHQSQMEVMKLLISKLETNHIHNIPSLPPPINSHPFRSINETINTEQQQQQQHSSKKGSKQPEHEDSNLSNRDNFNSDKENKNLLDLVVGLSSDKKVLADAEVFDRSIVDSIHNVSHSVLVLRRTRLVTVMAQRLMLAKTERDCYEIVSKLIVALFNVERCSYSLMVDDDNFMVMKCAVAENQFKIILHTNQIYPRKGSSYEAIARTGEMMYKPKSSESPFYDHKMINSMGLNSTVNVPIYLDGTHFYGSLNIATRTENAFTEHDLLLLKDVASTLGAHIYTHRLKKAEEKSHELFRDLLHSVIPPQVIGKILHYWQKEELDSQLAATISIPDNQRQQKIIRNNETSTTFKEHKNGFGKNNAMTSSNSKTRGVARSKSIQMKLSMFSKVEKRKRDSLFRTTSTESMLLQEQLSTVSGGASSNHVSPANTASAGDELSVSTSNKGTNKNNTVTKKALYAEHVSNVTIIFVDIVEFSRISMSIPSVDVMDMLQELFSRYDKLCAKHDVLKIETIGDGFLGATGLMDDSRDGKNNDSAAQRALAFAKDVVLEAQLVKVPSSHDESIINPTSEYSKIYGNSGNSRASKQNEIPKNLNVRVGLQSGDITCGVLGQKLPKFSVFGHTVNLAARMEQSSEPGKIHVTDEFATLVRSSSSSSSSSSDVEKEEEDDDDNNNRNTILGWEGPRMVHVKNIGEVKTWILTPLPSPHLDATVQQS